MIIYFCFMLINDYKNVYTLNNRGGGGVCVMVFMRIISMRWFFMQIVSIKIVMWWFCVQLVAFKTYY